ncbi:hypothetical protein [Rudaeicoccus suwonensis]|uniref:Bacteriocin biosynthesis cyclodehydratase domain-containing protein n=1 Tax=Rudaeicoccus suwonensis TaxID=657409 RepID=A0A561E1B0_9MICO|nr:hypothetical protein [Rudaeicoccus suwonensis]TWE09394.1 bacteriocin biosynthesis cyclodehydratase domain-containing protein [Rudaeicoccus suwonensis]
MSAQSVAVDEHRFPTQILPISARRRGPGEVLLERQGTPGLVVTGLSDAEVGAVVSLGPGVSGIDRLTARRHEPSRRWTDVLTVVNDAAGRLTPPAQSPGWFVVAGNGTVADQISAVLNRIGRQTTSDPVGVAAIEHDPPVVQLRPDLVVLPAAEALPPLAARRWHRHGISQLPVIVSGEGLTIGPLLRPGSGPCAQCLDLHRGDHDPGWAQWLAGRGTLERWQEPAHADPEVAAVAAGLVGLVARGVLRGRPLPLGVSLSVAAPQPRVLHHLWSRHPACCG